MAHHLQLHEAEGTALLVFPLHPSAACKEHLRTAEPPQLLQDRTSYFWPRLLLPMLIYILEHAIEKEPWIRGLVWLMTPWAHNPPHNSKPQLLLNCPQLIMVLSSSKARKIDGSLLHSSLCFLSWSAGKKLFWQPRKLALHPPEYLHKGKKHNIFLGWCSWPQCLAIVKSTWTLWEKANKGLLVACVTGGNENFCCWTLGVEYTPGYCLIYRNTLPRY